MPCLFPGKWIPGNHFPYFPMFGEYKENWSKETQFWSKKNTRLMTGKCFPFLILRKTLSFLFINKTCTVQIPNYSLLSHFFSLIPSMDLLNVLTPTTLSSLTPTCCSSFWWLSLFSELWWKQRIVSSNLSLVDGTKLKDPNLGVNSWE